MTISDDIFCVSQEAVEEEGLKFDKDIAEKAGMTTAQVEESLFKVLFAIRLEKKQR